jgi:nucleoid-associated protein YgaU
MGLLDFVKDAGASLFGGGEKEAEVVQRDLEDVFADKEKAKALTGLVAGMGMKVEDFAVKFRDGRATVTGKPVSQEEREKITLMIGNTQGVAQVDDRMVVAVSAAPEATAQASSSEAELYTVKSGDTLSGIAKTHYGNAMKYTAIFEANRPMLKDPNKIYPGQVLRIPSLEG